MDPQVLEQGCIEYQYTKFGRQTYFGDGLLSELRIDDLKLLLISSVQEWQFHIAIDI